MTICNLPAGVNLKMVGSEIATWNAFRQGIAQQHNGRFLHQLPDTIPQSVQLKMTIEGRSIDLLKARACLPELIEKSAPAAKKSIGFALETFDGIVRNSGGNAITPDGFDAFLTVAGFNLSDPLDQFKAQNYALQVGRLLEILLFVSVGVEKPEDTAIFGKVLHTAALQVYPKAGETSAEIKAKIAEAQTKATAAENRATAAEARAAAAEAANADEFARGKAEGIKQRPDDGGGKTIGIAGGAVGVVGLAASGLTMFLRRKDRLAHERQVAQNTVTRPEPGAVTVNQNADNTRSFLAWDPDAQGQRWSIRVQPYSEIEARTLLDSSLRGIEQLTRNGARDDDQVMDPKEQATLRIARGYVAQFGPLFPETP